MENIQKFAADGKAIQQLIYGRILPTLDGEPLGHCVLATIASAVILMKPDIDMDKLQEIITAVSQTIILHISEAKSDKEWDG